MTKNILEQIIKKKIEKVDLLKKSLKIKTLENLINKNKTFINFKEQISNRLINNQISIIAEIKKASPSAGILIDDYNPLEIAKIYYKNN